MTLPNIAFFFEHIDNALQTKIIRPKLLVVSMSSHLVHYCKRPDNRLTLLTGIVRDYLIDDIILVLHMYVLKKVKDSHDNNNMLSFQASTILPSIGPNMCVDINLRIIPFYVLSCHFSTRTGLKDRCFSFFSTFYLFCIMF